jgi:hypothetical protein
MAQVVFFAASWLDSHRVASSARLAFSPAKKLTRLYREHPFSFFAVGRSGYPQHCNAFLRI